MIRWARGLVLLLLINGGFCLAQTLPATRTKALDGADIEFPETGSHKPIVVMVGFSHKSSGQFEAWNKALLSRYIKDSQVSYFELVDLAGVPAMVKPMILHGMRRTIHGEEQSHFAPFYSDDAAWKKAVNFAAQDHAYLIVADQAGSIVWQTDGAPDDAKVAALQGALAKATAASR